MNELLTTEELSEKIKISTVTIRNYTCQKKIPYIKIGASVRFDPEEIQIWIDSKRKKTV